MYFVHHGRLRRGLLNDVIHHPRHLVPVTTEYPLIVRSHHATGTVFVIFFTSEHDPPSLGIPFPVGVPSFILGHLLPKDWSVHAAFSNAPCSFLPEMPPQRVRRSPCMSVAVFGSHKRSLKLEEPRNPGICPVVQPKKNPKRCQDKISGVPDVSF